jgi:hypothetical protein
MGKGNVLSGPYRQIIHNNMQSCNPLSPESLHLLLFSHNPTIMSIQGLSNRMNFMRYGDIDEIFRYVNMENKKKGRNKKFLEDADMTIESIIERNPSMRTQSVQQNFATMRGMAFDIPSISWINKCFTKLKYKFKVYTRMPILGDIYAKHRFMIWMRCHSDDDIWNLDEIKVIGGSISVSTMVLFSKCNCKRPYQHQVKYHQHFLRP